MDSVRCRYFSKEITGTWFFPSGKINTNNNNFDDQTRVEVIKSSTFNGLLSVQTTKILKSVHFEVWNTDANSTFSKFLFQHTKKLDPKFLAKTNYYKVVGLTVEIIRLLKNHW